MPLDFVATSSAPKAIGPYSQAVRASGFLFTAGQVALDPRTGELVAGGIAEQTTRAMENLKAILAAAGTDFSQVVKTTVFLVDMADFTAMNEVYARAFGDHRPARSTVAVAALPRGAKVEIEVIATVSGER
jgi:2-iminobutanoate/2-iminopropanoate deaminase